MRRASLSHAQASDVPEIGPAADTAPRITITIYPSPLQPVSSADDRAAGAREQSNKLKSPASGRHIAGEQNRDTATMALLVRSSQSRRNDGDKLPNLLTENRRADWRIPSTNDYAIPRVDGIP